MKSYKAISSAIEFLSYLALPMAVMSFVGGDNWLTGFVVLMGIITVLIAAKQFLVYRQPGGPFLGYYLCPGCRGDLVPHPAGGYFCRRCSESSQHGE